MSLEGIAVIIAGIIIIIYIIQTKEKLKKAILRRFS
jgi:uncharacterized protein YoxC